MLGKTQRLCCGGARRHAPGRTRCAAALHAAASRRRLLSSRGAADEKKEAYGPEPPPDWLLRLQADAEDDDEVAELLRDAAGNPAEVEARIRKRFNERRDSMLRTPTGSDTPMTVVFRDVDPFNLWIWAQVKSSMSADERETLSEVLKAWFIVGRLGGFSSSNTQVASRASDPRGSVSHMEYNSGDFDEGCAFHAMGDPEFRDNWMRCWFDLGTSDELALDVLINALANFSKEHTPVAQLVIGGVNPDWAEGADAPRRAMDGQAFQQPDGFMSSR